MERYKIIFKFILFILLLKIYIDDNNLCNIVARVIIKAAVGVGTIIQLGFILI